MSEPSLSPSPPPIGSLAIIGIVVAIGAGAFAYTAGWLSPHRLTPDEDRRLTRPARRSVSGPPPQPCQRRLLHRRLRINGNGAALSSAQIFARGEYPALGRFNLATPDAECARRYRACSRPRPSAVDAGRRDVALRHDRSSILPGLDT